MHPILFKFGDFVIGTYGLVVAIGVFFSIWLGRILARREKLDPEEVRGWRPNEIDPPATLQDREKVLEEMFQIALSDGQLDESELRVIREYARAWGVDPERLAEWTELYSFGDASGVERWFRRIGLFLFPAG